MIICYLGRWFGEENGVFRCCGSRDDCELGRIRTNAVGPLFIRLALLSGEVHWRVFVEVYPTRTEFNIVVICYIERSLLFVFLRGRPFYRIETKHFDGSRLWMLHASI